MKKIICLLLACAIVCGAVTTIRDSGKNLDCKNYINQGDYPVQRGESSQTIAQAGSLDCCIAMILSYTGNIIPVEEISKNVNSEGLLPTDEVLAEYGFTQGENTYDDFINGVRSEIDNDRPVLVHIKGYWKSGDGKVLHDSESSHFLTATGYSESGIYVLDPAKKSNHLIAYNDWTNVADLYYRPVYKN